MKCLSLWRFCSEKQIEKGSAVHGVSYFGKLVEADDVFSALEKPG